MLPMRSRYLVMRLGIHVNAPTLNTQAFSHMSEVSGKQPFDVAAFQDGVAKRLTALLKARGKSVNWLAGELGMVQSTVARQFKGKALALPVVVGAAYLLDVPVETILFEQNRRTEKPAPSNREQATVEPVGETERIGILRLLSFLSQVVASGPTSSFELMEDLKALGSILHIPLPSEDILGGGTPPERGGEPDGPRPEDDE